MLSAKSPISTWILEYVHLTSQIYRVSRTIGLKQSDTPVTGITKLLGGQMYHYKGE